MLICNLINKNPAAAETRRYKAGNKRGKMFTLHNIANCIFIACMNMLYAEKNKIIQTNQFCEEITEYEIL